MAQEYIAIVEKSNDIGFIAINKSVFQTIVINIIEESEEVSFADTNSLIHKVPLQTKLTNEQLVIQMAIKVKADLNVNEVCAKLQTKIHEDIKHMSGYSCDIIDIKVAGFIF